MSNSNTLRDLVRLGALLGAVLAAGVSLPSCRKDDPNADRKEYIEFYRSLEDEEPSTWVSVPVMGGEVKLPVKANVEFTASWQDELTSPWGKVTAVEKKGDDLYEVTLEVKPRSTYGYYTRRSGMLLLSAPEKSLGCYVDVHQGLLARLSNDFSWAKYGTSDPRKLDGIPFASWILTDRERGWLPAPTDPDEAKEYKPAVFGKNGFIQLGDDEGHGAVIHPPFVDDIRNDSLAVVSFRAVTYSDLEGHRDNGKLTVEIIGGGAFRDNGETVMEFDVPGADITSENYPANFWWGSEYLLGIVSLPKNPFTGNTRIRFTAGDPAATGTPNRIFIDNVYIRKIVEKNGDEDLFLANGGSGKDNLLGPAPLQTDNSN